MLKVKKMGLPISTAGKTLDSEQVLAMFHVPIVFQ
jgi:hypothetical protein